MIREATWRATALAPQIPP